MEVRVLPPEPMPSNPEAKRSGPGCLTIALLLPAVVIVGFVVGAALNQQEDPDAERSVTLDEGTLDGVEWRVDALRDVEGDFCAFLYEDGAQLTGACTLTPQDATFGDQTVVFGKAASNTTSVAVVLSDGETVDIDTVTADGLDGRYYVQVVEGDVDAERLG
ncbi:MAG: hypothetical protein ABIP36_02505 [Acidimicrobiales bacterium]